MKRLLNSPLIRISIIAIFGILEFALTTWLLDYVFTQFAWLDVAVTIVSLIILFGVIRNSRHLSADIFWILLIAAAPVIGTTFYLVLGASRSLNPTTQSIVAETERAEPYYHPNPETLEKVKETEPNYYGQLYYVQQEGGFPVYENTGFTYYPLGDVGFPHMLADIEKAEHFCFLEYFIIQSGEMWDSMLDVLERKAAEGVDVRVLYDDMGSVSTLPSHYAKDLEKRGIKCSAFNRLNPVVSVFLNNRDHRKIMVIDGKVAYTGGINLADEYVNVRERFGHWKDNVARVTGEAVWSFTVMFLTTWNALRHEDRDWEVFHVAPDASEGEPDGFIAPYGETPLDVNLIGENIYLNVLNQANDYCYIFTPYLVIDSELRYALMLAAKRGVDVRIITPGVPDKKLVWNITRSHYAQLIGDGVRIFEYSPGFVHSKVIVSDDQVATVGTLNFDYRSLTLNFENGVLLCGSKEISAIRKDFEETFPQCCEMTQESSTEGPIMEFLLSVARLVAPML